jgi:hypothetical protein
MAYTACCSKLMRDLRCLAGLHNTLAATSMLQIHLLPQLCRRQQQPRGHAGALCPALCSRALLVTSSLAGRHGLCARCVGRNTVTSQPEQATPAYGLEEAGGRLCCDPAPCPALQEAMTHLVKARAHGRAPQALFGARLMLAEHDTLNMAMKGA